MPKHSEPTLFSSLPSITNNYTITITDPQRVVKRKRSYDPYSNPACTGKCQYRDGENDPSSRLITKRTRVVAVSDASHKAHAFTNADMAPCDRGCTDDSTLSSSLSSPSVLALSPSSSTIDVANFITLLLDGLNKHSHSPPSPSEFSSEQLIKPPSPYQRRPTSPLAQSPFRQPFVRKRVGGQCAGRVEPSLKRWVLYQNHMQDIRSCPPHLRSAEWIETLHEMGWENLHPSYALDVGDIFIPGPEDDSEDDLLEVDIGQYAQMQRLDGKM